MGINVICLWMSIKVLQIESESLDSEVDTFNCCHISPPLSYPVLLWNHNHAEVGLFFYCFLNLLHVPEHCWSTYSQRNGSCQGMLSDIPFSHLGCFWEPNTHFALSWGILFCELNRFLPNCRNSLTDEIPFFWEVTYIFTCFYLPSCQFRFFIYLY